MDNLIVKVDDNKPKSLRDDVLLSISNYLKNMGNVDNSDVSRILLSEEVESAMYEGIMKHTKGNQSKAAKMLGVSRGTLRTKLIQHFKTTHVGGIYKV